MLDSENMTEASKAVQEVAKTTGKTVDAIREFGGFIARVTAGSIEQAAGIFEDKLKYMRWENQLNLMKKVELKLHEVGLKSPSRSIPLKLAVPLLEAAALEDDDSLQDRWAALIVNGANAASGIEIRRSYINILETLTPLDAKILQTIYSRPKQDSLEDGVWTSLLPNVAASAPVLSQDGYQNQPTNEVKVSLANLDRLGLIRVDEAFYGGQIFSKAHLTFLGEDFFRSCTLQNTSEIARR
jgi:hypothetical protein